MVWARIECLDVSDNSVIGCLKLYLWVRSGGGSDFLGLERRIGFIGGESSVGFSGSAGAEGDPWSERTDGALWHHHHHCYYHQDHHQHLY